MKTKLLLNILLVFLSTYCFSQNVRIENKIMECYYVSYADSGNALKKLINEYENLLVNERILADKSGESYLDILTKIAKENKVEKNPSVFFSTELKNINKSNFKNIQKCIEAVNKDSSLYKKSKLKNLHEITNLNNLDSFKTASILSKKILQVLTKEDFELVFYKMRIFILLEVLNVSEKDFGLYSLTDNKAKEGINNALNIYIDRNNQFFVNNKKVGVKELKIKIYNYEEKNKSQSIITLKVEHDSYYETYLNVKAIIKSEIMKLRTEFAKEKYNKALNDLSREETSNVRKFYPQKIIE